MLCIYFFLIGCGALSLRFIWQTRKSIVGDSCDVSVPRDPSVKITPKTPANFASLNSSIAFGDLRLGGCLRGPPSQAPARAQSPARNTRIKRRKSRKDFVGYFDVPGSRVFTSEFTVRALYIWVFYLIFSDVAAVAFLKTVLSHQAQPSTDSLRKGLNQ